MIVFINAFAVKKMRNKEEKSIELERIWLSMIPSIIVIVVEWLVYLLDFSEIFGKSLYLFGILPRHINGLIGIVLSPFIHESYMHLLSNTLPLFVLLWCLFYFYRSIAIKSLLLLWLLSGSLTWIIGRESYHIGASGIIFSLIFFLFFSGIFRNHIPLIAVSLIVAFVYGSSLWSIFPFAQYIDANLSWEGHLSGAISGFVIAFAFRNQGPQKPEKIWDDDDNEVSREDESERENPADFENPI